MQTELEKIKENVMNKINDEKVKMKPKWWFLLGSISVFIGLTLSIITSVFLVSFIRFALRSHGMINEYKTSYMIINFPWWTLLFAIIFIYVGFWLMKKYDFSYKIKPIFIIIGFILATFIAGWFLDTTGINDTISKKGPMKKIMKGYMKKELNLQPPKINKKY